MPPTSGPPRRDVLDALLILRLGLLSDNEWLDEMRSWSQDASKLTVYLESRGLLSADQREAVSVLSNSLVEDGRGLDELITRFLPGEPLRTRLSELRLWQPLFAEATRTFQDQTTDFDAMATRDFPDTSVRHERGELRDGHDRYEVLGTHAEGGLGRVSAARDRELGRRVAFKQIRPEFAQDADSRRRFVFEAEVTGRLEHPGIVPVYSLAADEQDNPYYAMRFIDGVTLQDAIDQFHGADRAATATARSQSEATRESRSSSSTSALEFRQLLNRFIDLCNAIDFAHDRGFLHRDLKPANVMLGRFGETLVVDWGLARHIGSESQSPDEEPEAAAATSSSPNSTQDGTLIGTPAYMSPEQASGRLDELGPASDIYSLGAILYAILTGGRAVESGNVRQVIEDVRAGRFKPPRDRSADVPRPLNAICLRAMARDPEQRYPSARELAADVERWLADEPVLAWSEPWSVRTRRWMKRHRVTVASSLVGLVIATLSLAIILGLQRQANSQLARSFAKEQAASEDARRKFSLALSAIEQYHNDVTSDFLLGQAEFKELRASLLAAPRSFYAQLSARLADEEEPSREQREALFNAHIQLAELTDSLEGPRQSIDLFTKAIELNSELLSDSPKNTEYLRDRTSLLVTLGRLESLVGNLQKAHAHLEEADEIVNRLPELDPQSHENDALRGEVLGQKASVLSSEGRLNEATQVYEESLKIRRRLMELEPQDLGHRSTLAAMLNDYGTLLANQRKNRESEQAARESAVLQQQVVAANPANAFAVYHLASMLTNLAYLLQDTDRTQEALEVYAQSQPLFEHLVSEGPNVVRFQSGLASTLNNQGLLYSDGGQFDQAEEKYRRALEIKARIVQDYPLVIDYRVSLAGGYTNFGGFLLRRGDAASSVEWFQRAIDELESVLEENPRHATSHFFLRQSYINLGQSLRALERYDAAAEAFHSAIAHDTDPKHRRTTQHEWIQSTAQAGRHVEAVELAGMLEGTAVSDGDYFNLAFIYALAVDAARNDTDLDAEARTAAVGRYGERAVDALRKMNETGRVPKDRFQNLLENNEFLEPLRGLEEFETLRAEIGE